MKKIAVIAGSFMLIILGVLGWMYLANSREADEQNKQAASTAQEKTSTTTDETDTPTSPSGDVAKTEGAYVVYSDDIIASTEGTKVLFFHAPWCPQCHALHTDINASEIPSGITIIKTDYDSYQDLRQKYGVTLQTTFVLVDDAGELVQKYVAYNEPTFKAVKENLLEDSE